MALDDYPLYVHWYQTLDGMLDAIDRFPKHTRFTLGQRLVQAGLDVMEGIVSAIYDLHPQPRTALDQVNLRLEWLRVLFRIAHGRQYLSTDQYATISEQIDIAGRMAGAWRKRGHHQA